MPRFTAEFTSTALSRGSFLIADGDDTGSLDITFASGRSFTYENVPMSVWEGLRDAPSPGSYFHANIKDAY